MSNVDLKAVDSLEFIILVDNSIEWMTKLPSGFQHEALRQLTSNPPVDSLTKASVLDLDHYCCGAHGLAVLVITRVNGQTYHTLFDSGPEGASLARNLDSMKVDLNKIDRVVLSHWHRDHSGGISEFLKLRKAAASQENKAQAQAVIDLHPSRPIARGIAPPPTFDKVIARLPEDPTFEELEALGGKVELSDQGHTIQGDSIYVSGEIPRQTAWEKGLLGSVRWITSDTPENGKWIAEPEILDERYIAIDVANKGLVIFSSCSHAGICNVVADATSHFNRPVHAVVGGLHLAGPELASRIPPTVDFLKNKVSPPPKYILPLHCTGFNAKVALAEAFGEACVPAGTGITVTMTAD